MGPFWSLVGLSLGFVVGEYNMMVMWWYRESVINWLLYIRSRSFRIHLDGFLDKKFKRNLNIKPHRNPDQCLS